MKSLFTLRKRGLALFLVLTMCLSLLQVTAFAEMLDAGTEPGSVEYVCGKTAHTHGDECYTVTPETKRLTCTLAEGGGHAHSDECYTVSETKELTCTDVSEDHVHGDACYMVSETRELTCWQEESAGHTHSDDCYTIIPESKELICTKQEHTHTEDCLKKAEPPVVPECVCVTRCTADSVNAECPACSAEGADLTLCKGQVPVVSEIPEAVQAFLDAVAALPALATIPEKATEAEIEALRARVDACQDAYDALSVEDMEREDVTAAIATLGAVIEAVTGIQLLVEGDTVSVNTFKELTAAIAAADGPTTIKLANEIVTEGVITIASGKDITLTADEGAVLTRGNAAHYINVAAGGKLVLNNITLNGNAKYSSSANAMLSVAASGSATVQNAVMQYCWTQKLSQGSAVHSLGTLVMTDVAIQDYYSPSMGGGVYLAGGSASLTRVTITSRYSDTGQYALYAKNVSDGLTMSGCNLSGNTLKSSSGSYVLLIDLPEGTNSTLTDCTINDNSVPGSAGIYLKGSGSVTLRGCTISGNTVKNNTVYADNRGGVVLENTVIKENTCTNSGSSTIPSVGGVRAGYYIEFKSGAIYNNSGLDIYASHEEYEKPGSILYHPATTYSLIKASEMSDEGMDFSNYVWSKNSVEEIAGPISGSGELRLKAQVGTATPYEATINGELYGTLAEAMEEAKSGDTIELTPCSIDNSGNRQDKEAYQYKISEPLVINKDVTIQLNNYEILYSGAAEDPVLFNVVGGGSLSLLNPDDTTNPAQLPGTITITGGGALTMQGAIVGSTTIPMVVDVQNGAFTINGPLYALPNFSWPLTVKLAAGQYITAGEQFSIGAVTLDLADAFYEAGEPPVLIEGYTDNVGSLTIYIASQRKGYAVTVDKTAGNTVLKKLAVDNSGVYLDPVEGSDDLDGSAPEQAVKTLENAMRLAAESKLIYVLNPIEISSNLDGYGVTLKRYYTNRDFLLKPTADLTLTNITLDGSASDFEVDNGKSLIDVRGCQVTLDSGVKLKNNDVSNQRTTSGDNLYFGGGVLVEEKGHLVMNDGAVIEGCAAQSGGGVAIINNTAKMTMNGGVIQNNSAFEGGGIAQLLAGEDGTQTEQSTELFIYGGTIDGNTAVGNGGGIYVQSTNTAQIGSEDLTDSKVYITNNSAGKYGAAEFGGGGIYVNGGKEEYQNGSLQLYRAVVTENSAQIGGGGFAGCPTSNTVIGLTNGGAFYDNSNTDVITDWFATSPPMPGDTNFPPAWISPVMLGGHPYNWQHTDGSEVYWNELFETGKYIRFSSDPTEDAKAAAKADANVFITGNTSGTRGGGIGSNGDVTIGTVPPTLGQLTIKNGFAEDSDPDAKPENKEYIFTVTGPDGSIGKVKIKGTGDVTLNGLPEGGYTVTLDESSAQIPRYEWNVNISGGTVSEDTYGSTLAVTPTEFPEVTFIHTYTPKPATKYTVVHEYYTNGVRDGVVETVATDGYVDDTVNARDIEKKTATMAETILTRLLSLKS